MQNDIFPVVVQTFAGEDYTAEAKTLMQYVVAYAAAANTYFGFTDEILTSAITNNEITLPEAYTKNYETLASMNSNSLATVFYSVYIDVNGAAPMFVFKVKNGFNGTVNIGGTDYDAVSGKTIEVSNLLAYNFIDEITVKCEETGMQTTFEYGNYAAFQSSAKDQAIVDALYDYCYAAQLYKLSLEAAE